MDDDYVAQILAKEAKESSIKYSTQGLSALMPSRPTSNAPKPNTRFLRNLIKVTDSHNTALRLKEEKEARERMRQLKHQTSRDSGASALTSTDRSSRRSGHRGEARGSREDQKEEQRDCDRSRRKRSRSRSHSAGRDRSRRHRRRTEDYDGTEVKDRHCDDHRHLRRDHESHRRDRRDRHKDHTRRRRDRSYSRSPSRSPRRDRSTDRSTDRHHHRRSDFRSTHSTHSRFRSRSPGSYKPRRSNREDASPHDTRRSSLETSSRHKRPSPPPMPARQHEMDDESDPLEDLVGPLPPRQNENPIRSRGRGAYKPNLSNIDAHFAPGYDPTTDVHLDDDSLNSMGQQSSRRPVTGLMTKDDDWDMAMEALRDRERWRAKGEERLRSAGINEATITQWKNNTAFTGMNGEGKPEDVQWAKKGEGREWDRGKFVNEDGHIDIRAAW